MTTHTITRLRPVNQWGRVAGAITHLFSDEDYWFDYRMALCGKEVLRDQLTTDRVAQAKECQTCNKKAAGG